MGGGGGGGRHPAPSIIMSLNAVNTLSSHLASLTAECSQAAHVRGTTHCCYGTDDCAIAHQPEIWSECYECTTKSCIYPCSTMLNKDTIKPLYVLSPLKCIVSLHSTLHQPCVQLLTIVCTRPVAAGLWTGAAREGVGKVADGSETCGLDITCRRNTPIMFVC